MITRQVIDGLQRWRHTYRMQLIHRPVTFAGWARVYLNVFRSVVVATAFAFAAYGWFAHVQWLVAAGVTIGLGEFIECTYYLLVLNWGEARGDRST